MSSRKSTAITIDDSIKTIPRYIKLHRNKILSLEETRRYYAVRAGCGICSAIFLHWEDARQFVAAAGCPPGQRVEYAAFASIEEAAGYLVEGERKKKAPSKDMVARKSIARLSPSRHSVIAANKKAILIDDDAIETTPKQLNHCWAKRPSLMEEGGHRRFKRPSLEQDCVLLSDLLTLQSLWASPAAPKHTIGFLHSDSDDDETTFTTSERARSSSPRWEVYENQVRSLPPSYPLEETSVFVPQDSARSIAARITKVLQERDIAASYDVLKTKARCVSKAGVEFRIRLYRGEGVGYKHGIIIEIKRRKGFDLGYGQDVYAILNAAEGLILGRRGLGVHMSQSRVAHILSLKEMLH